MRRRERSMSHVAVIGLGRFGLTVARTLVAQGHDVLGIDGSEEAVQRAKDMVTHAVQAVLYEATVVRELGLNAVDAAIVALGTDMEANIVSTALLVEAGVPHVVARANSPLHGLILTRVGAHRVVYPEVASGEAVARSLRAPDVTGHLTLGPEMGISTLRAPAGWVGRSVAELRLPEHGAVTILAIQRGSQTLAMPDAVRVQDGDILALLAHESTLEALPRRAPRRH